MATAISLVAYYYNPSGGIDAIFLGVGVTVFAVLLFLMILCKEVKFIEERRMMDIYRELAFKDNLELELASEKPMTLPPRLSIAVSKLSLVLVLGS